MEWLRRHVGEGWRHHCDNLICLVAVLALAFWIGSVLLLALACIGLGVAIDKLGVRIRLERELRGEHCSALKHLDKCILKLW